MHRETQNTKAQRTLWENTQSEYQRLTPSYFSVQPYCTRKRTVESMSARVFLCGFCDESSLALSFKLKA
jgi:hypothetical protein